MAASGNLGCLLQRGDERYTGKSYIYIYIFVYIYIEREREKEVREEGAREIEATRGKESLGSRFIRA